MSQMSQMSQNDIHYQKRKNAELFKCLEKKNILSLSSCQNYIPIYNRFFSLNETNYNSINLNNNFYIDRIKNKTYDNINLFTCSIKNVKTEQVKDKQVFIKLAPLLDPYKYLIGKYNILDNKIYQLPTVNSNETNCHSKFLDVNNSAYVDGFFIFLTSKLNENYNFFHGINYYGSFLSIKNDFKLNIFDDLEYLNNSEFFNKQKNILFKIDNYEHLIRDDKELQKLKPIKIHYNSSEKSNLTLSFKNLNHELNNDLFEDIFTNDDSRINIHSLDDMNEISFDIDGLTSDKITTIKSTSTCSSRTSYTIDAEPEDFNIDDEKCSNCNSDEEYDNESVNKIENDDDCWEDINSTVSEEEIFATIKKFPVQVICMENCENTMDDLIMNNTLSNDEWFSMLMQIIMILLTYQKVFSFTHNDLHTNNVMYNETKHKYIIYHYNNKIYKVPTFGKIFKIIDFGRSIYKFQGKIFCSDSFKNGNDAASQYNIEPYFNELKPRLEPNYSFDLSRLACAIFDYLVEDLEEIKDISKLDDPIKKLIVEWCLDDKGINLLYKNNGDERYPDFKLYKMIARHVHNHTPQKQLDRPEFKQFLVEKNTILEKNIAAVIEINIDKMLILQ